MDTHKTLECPICGHFGQLIEGGTFLDPLLPVVGSGTRICRCSQCGTKERHRLQFLYLSEIVDRTLLQNVLHVAPFPPLQRVVSKLAENYTAVGLAGGEGIETGDLTALRYPDNSFKLVICSHVLEHIDDDHQAMAELCRVLQPGGVCLVQVPQLFATTIEVRGRQNRIDLFGIADHRRVYGVDLPSKLTAAGFWACEAWDWTASQPWHDHALLADERLFLASKPPHLK